MDAANSLVAATEQLNYVVRETMGAEIALLEARRMETAEQLLTMVASYKLLGEQLWTTQEQAARAHALLEQQQAQLTEMQKRLTAQQRRAVRLQSEVHAARLVMTEHAKVQEAAAEVPRLKEQAAQHLLVQRAVQQLQTGGGIKDLQNKGMSIGMLADEQQETMHQVAVVAVQAAWRGFRAREELQQQMDATLEDAAATML